MASTFAIVDDLLIFAQEGSLFVFATFLPSHVDRAVGFSYFIKNLCLAADHCLH